VRRGPEVAPRSKSGIFDNPKMQGKPVLDLIQDTGTGSEVWYIRDEPRLKSGTGAQMTTKSSIRNWGAPYKSGVYALKVTCLTLGGLSCVPLIAGLRGEQFRLWRNRMGEVSGGHSRCSAGKASEALQGRKAEKRICRAVKLILKA